MSSSVPDTAPPASLPVEPVLPGRRCLLRPIDPVDGAMLAARTHDSVVARYMLDGFNAGEWCRADSRALGFLRWGIVPVTTPFVEPCTCPHAAVPPAVEQVRQPAPVGVVILAQATQDGMPERACAEAAYWIDPAWWGHGLATEALRLVCAWTWEAMPAITRLRADVVVGNDASCRVALKAGLGFEGVRRLAALKNGRRVNVLRYSASRMASTAASCGRSPVKTNIAAGASL